MAPITWRNIGLGGVGRGQAALSLAATKNFENATNSLQGILDKNTEIDETNWEQTKQNQTDSILGSIADNQNYSDLADMSVTDYTDEYGAQFDKSTVTAALLKQKTGAKEHLIGSAINQMSGENLTGIKRQENFAQYFKDQGVNEGEIPGFVQDTFSMSEGKRTAIKDQAIQTNTTNFLNTKGLTSANYDQQYMAARTKNGFGNMNDKIIQDNKNILGQQESTAIYTQAQQAVNANNGDLGAGFDVIRNSNGKVAPEVLGNLLDRFEKDFTPRKFTQQQTAFSIAEAGLRNDIAFQTDMQDVLNKQTELTTKVELYGPSEQRIQAAATATFKDPSARKQLIRDNRAIFMNDLDADDVALQQRKMEDMLIPPMVISQIFMEIAGSGEVSDHSFWSTTGKGKIFKDAVDRKVLQYKALADLTTELTTVNNIVNSAKQQHTLQAGLGQIKAQRAAAKHSGSKPFYAKSFYNDTSTTNVKKFMKDMYTPKPIVPKPKSGKVSGKKAGVGNNQYNGVAAETPLSNTSSKQTPEQKLKAYYQDVENKKPKVKTTEITNMQGERVLINAITGDFIKKIKGKK